MMNLVHVYFLYSPGKLCIEVTNQSKIVWISESLCIGCGICIKVCSFLPKLAVDDQTSFSVF